MYSDDRQAYRAAFYTAWQKHLQQLPTTAVEKQLIHVIAQHPEYHALMSNQKKCLTEDFPLEANPFFHMSLHLTIQEQIQLDRPSGVKAIYAALLQQYRTPIEVEHEMVTCLARTLYHASMKGVPPDENDYLRQLRDLQTS